MKKTLAMILAGGKGERMDVLCHHRAKPMLPFAGNLRVIDFSLSNCVHSGIKNIAAVTDYNRSGMADYLLRWSIANNQLNNLTILEPKVSSFGGTADAIYQNLDFIKKCGAETIIILAGDHIYKMDYRKMLTFHEKTNADVTIGVVSVPIEQAHRFGIVSRDTEGRVLHFEEKPETPQSNLASMGIYVFNRETLERRLLEDAALSASRHDFGYSLLPKMVSHDRVFAYKFNNYWQDIGTIDCYYNTNLEYINHHQFSGLNGNWPILTAEPIIPISNKYNQYKPSDNKKILHSIVSESCIVKGIVENSVLSPSVYVDEQAIVRNSVIMANTYIGYHSIVESSILEENSTIGEYCYIGFGSPYSSKKKCLVLNQGTKIPSNIAVFQNGNMTLHNWDTLFKTKSFPWGAIITAAEPHLEFIQEESLALT